MIKIGEFSKLARVSVRMLRHYEKLDLLQPSFVDDSTGYRYYKPKQLGTINKISLLKQMGFSLIEIKDLIEHSQDDDKLKEALLRQKEIIIKEDEAIKNRLLILDNTINDLNKETNIMEYTVIAKEMPARHILSVRQVIERYENEGMLWGIMGEEMNNQAVKLANPCYAIAVFHDNEYREVDVDVEVQISVEGNYTSTDKAKFIDVDSFLIASTILEGSYEKMNEATQAVVEWIENNNYEMNGSNFNINHVSPGQESDPEKWVTEVCIPIRKK